MECGQVHRTQQLRILGKRLMLLTNLLIGILLILLLVCCSSLGSHPNIEEATMASAVDKYQKPLEKRDVFTMDEKTIYCTAKVDNVRKDTVVTARWLLVEGDLVGRGNIEVGYHEAIISKPTYISFALNQEGDSMFPRGQYEVVLSINNKEASIVPFTVEKPPSPQLTISTYAKPDFELGEKISKSFSWKYKSREWTWVMDIPKAMYDYYKAKPRILTSDPALYSIYVTHPIDDPAIATLAACIEDIATKNDFNVFDKVGMTLSFVRSLPYIADFQSIAYDEYQRFPIETLVDGKGDCEDTSILFASLVDSLGMVSSLLISPTHCAVGISGGDLGDTFFEYGGKKYYYVETTKSNLQIGQMPDIFKGQNFTVVPFDPIPLVGHTFDEWRVGKVVRVKVQVENLGAVPAEDIQVTSGFMLEENEISNQQHSEKFELQVDGKATVIFYLDCPFSGRTQLLVRTLYSGDRVYETYCELECK